MHNIEYTTAQGHAATIEYETVPDMPTVSKRYNPLVDVSRFSMASNVEELQTREDAGMPRYSEKSSAILAPELDRAAILEYIMSPAGGVPFRDEVSTEIVLYTPPQVAPENMTLDELSEELKDVAPVALSPVELYQRAGKVLGGKPKRQKVAKVAKVATAHDPTLPAFPDTLDRDVLELWARRYCGALCDKFQSQKLVHKLFGSPFNASGGSLNWQIAAIPENRAQRGAWLGSAKLSFDKKVGA